jgi:hypothetical protein
LFQTSEADQVHFEIRGNFVRLVLLATATSILMLSGPLAAAERQPQMSALQIQSIQTKEFEASKEMVFGSVMSVLQDAGYRIKAADLVTGLITGAGATERKRTFLGGDNYRAPVVTAFVEQFGKITKVRLNFVVEKSNFDGLSTRSKGEDIILDAAVYRETFEKIDQALFIRQGLQAK